MEYERLPESDIEKYLPIVSLLIVTATEIETEEFHKKLTGFTNNKILIISQGKQTYYLGIFGVYGIVHVECRSMGSVMDGASITTVTNAIDCWKPKAVTMIGIAFGVDSEKQNIGDVLVSEAIIPYGIKRVGNKIIQRGIIPPAGSVLVDRFKNAVKHWVYELPGGKLSKVIPTHVLSGESLIDNNNYKNEILSSFPNSKGGEMEGVGVFTAASNKDLEWIVVKAICDFADGNKGVNKKENQKLAAESAVSFCLFVFSQKFSFDALGFKEVNATKINGPFENKGLLSKVIFDKYDKVNEPYYLQRVIDNEIRFILEYYSLWLNGLSGVGKTNVILRYLKLNNKKHLLIDLGCSVNNNLIDAFKQIYFDICTYFEVGVPHEHKGLTDINQIVKLTETVINSCKVDKELYILIEEIPIENSDDYGSFISYLFPLIQTSSEIKFILSTINDPNPYLKSYQQKIKEKIKFKSIEAWSVLEMKELLGLISSSLGIEFREDEVQKIAASKVQTPRFIKKFLKDYLIANSLQGYNLDRVLRETEKDLSNS